MTAAVEQGHLDWARNLMRVLTEGGAWAIPRSALAFKKQGNALVLVGRMKHHDALPMTADEWADFQNDDFAGTKAVFEKAGFEVRDETEGKQT